MPKRKGDLGDGIISLLEAAEKLGNSQDADTFYKVWPKSSTVCH